MVGTPDISVQGLPSPLVEALAPRPKQVERPVPAVKGLYVIEYASGRRSYVFRFRSPVTGKKTCIVVGNNQQAFTDIIILVVQMQAQLAQGLDPGRATLTLAEWFDRIFKPSIMKRLKSWRNHVNRFDNHIRSVLGHRPVNLITPAELVVLIEGLTPAEGCLRDINFLSDASTNRITALVKVIFSTLHAQGVISTNPARFLKCRRERNLRGRVLRAEEVDGFFAALETAPVKVKLLILLMLLTGMRIGEARRCRWCYLDRANRLLRIPDSKSGKPRIIPLSEQAFLIIEALLALKVNDWLFPGQGDGPMSAPSKQFRKLVTLAGADGLWLHDIRRSFSSVASQTGTDMISLSRVLGHSHVTVTERYVVTHDKQLHAAVAGVGQHFQPFLSRLTSPSRVSEVSQPILEVTP